MLMENAPAIKRRPKSLKTIFASSAKHIQSMCLFCNLTYCLSFCLGQCTVLLSALHYCYAHALLDSLSNSNGDIPCQLNTKK